MLILTYVFLTQLTLRLQLKDWKEQSSSVIQDVDSKMQEDCFAFLLIKRKMWVFEIKWNFLKFSIQERECNKDEFCVAGVRISAETDCILFQKDGPASPFSNRCLSC